MNIYFSEAGSFGNVSTLLWFSFMYSLTRSVCCLSKLLSSSSEILKTSLRRTKKKAPGFTKKNIQILQKCTNKTLEQLKNIFNACLSTGYFPDIFKEAIIKFIPKKDKSPLNPINYVQYHYLKCQEKFLKDLYKQDSTPF